MSGSLGIRAALLDHSILRVIVGSAMAVADRLPLLKSNHLDFV
jgi:hypothetical protein